MNLKSINALSNQYKRVLFIRTDMDEEKKHIHPRDILPPLAIGYAARILEDKGYEIKFIDNRIETLAENKLARLSIEWNPDIIFLYTESWGLDSCIAYANDIKKLRKNMLIIAIGPLVSCAPETLVYKGSSIDAALLGECELSPVSLIERLNKKGTLRAIKSIYLPDKHNAKVEVINDLDKLPIPKYELFDPSKYISLCPLKLYKKVKWGYLLSSRGCPYECIFCSPLIRERYNKKVKLRSPERVADEIESLIRLGANVISFNDDDFTLSRQHVIKVCNEIKRRNLAVKWIAQARIDEVDKELLGIMKEAGCILLKFGIESGSNRIIRILRKTNKEIDWAKRTKEIFGHANQLGISTLSFFMIGSPTETEEELHESINLAKEIKPDIIQVHFFTAYRGSAACSRYKKELKDDNPYHYASGTNISRISNERLKELHRAFYKKFYLNIPFLLDHYRKFGLFYLKNPKVWKKLASHMINL